MDQPLTAATFKAIPQILTKMTDFDLKTDTRGAADQKSEEAAPLTSNKANKDGVRLLRDFIRDAKELPGNATWRSHVYRNPIYRSILDSPDGLTPVQKAIERLIKDPKAKPSGHLAGLIFYAALIANFIAPLTRLQLGRTVDASRWTAIESTGTPGALVDFFTKKLTQIAVKDLREQRKSKKQGSPPNTATTLYGMVYQAVRQVVGNDAFMGPFHRMRFIACYLSGLNWKKQRFRPMNRPDSLESDPLKFTIESRMGELTDELKSQPADFRTPVALMLLAINQAALNGDNWLIPNFGRGASHDELLYYQKYVPDIYTDTYFYGRRGPSYDDEAGVASDLPNFWHPSPAINSVVIVRGVYDDALPGQLGDYLDQLEEQYGGNPLLQVVFDYSKLIEWGEGSLNTLKKASGSEWLNYPATKTAIKAIQQKRSKGVKQRDKVVEQLLTADELIKMAPDTQENVSLEELENAAAAVAAKIRVRQKLAQERSVKRLDALQSDAGASEIRNAIKALRTASPQEAIAIFARTRANDFNPYKAKLPGVPWDMIGQGLSQSTINRIGIAANTYDPAGLIARARKLAMTLKQLPDATLKKLYATPIDDLMSEQGDIAFSQMRDDIILRVAAPIELYKRSVRAYNGFTRSFFGQPGSDKTGIYGQKYKGTKSMAAQQIKVFQESNRNLINYDPIKRMSGQKRAIWEKFNKAFAVKTPHELIHVSRLMDFIREPDVKDYFSTDLSGTFKKGKKANTVAGGERMSTQTFQPVIRMYFTTADLSDTYSEMSKNELTQIAVEKGMQVRGLDKLQLRRLLSKASRGLYSTRSRISAMLDAYVGRKPTVMYYNKLALTLEGKELVLRTDVGKGTLTPRAGKFKIAPRDLTYVDGLMYCTQFANYRQMMQIAAMSLALQHYVVTEGTPVARNMRVAAGHPVSLKAEVYHKRWLKRIWPKSKLVLTDHMYHTQDFQDFLDLMADKTPKQVRQLSANYPEFAPIVKGSSAMPAPFDGFKKGSTIDYEIGGERKRLIVQDAAIELLDTIYMQWLRGVSVSDLMRQWSEVFRAKSSGKLEVTKQMGPEFKAGADEEVVMQEWYTKLMRNPRKTRNVFGGSIIGYMSALLIQNCVKSFDFANATMAHHYLFVVNSRYAVKWLAPKFKMTGGIFDLFCRAIFRLPSPFTGQPAANHADDIIHFIYSDNHESSLVLKPGMRIRIDVDNFFHRIYNEDGTTDESYYDIVSDTKNDVHYIVVKKLMHLKYSTDGKQCEAQQTKAKLQESIKAILDKYSLRETSLGKFIMEVGIWEITGSADLLGNNYNIPYLMSGTNFTTLGNNINSSSQAIAMNIAYKLLEADAKRSDRNKKFPTGDIVEIANGIAGQWYTIENAVATAPNKRMDPMNTDLTPLDFLGMDLVIYDAPTINPEMKMQIYLDEASSQLSPFLPKKIFMPKAKIKILASLINNKTKCERTEPPGEDPSLVKKKIKIASDLPEDIRNSIEALARQQTPPVTDRQVDRKALVVQATTAAAMMFTGYARDETYAPLLQGILLATREKLAEMLGGDAENDPTEGILMNMEETEYKSWEVFFDDEAVEALNSITIAEYSMALAEQTYFRIYRYPDIPTEAVNPLRPITPEMLFFNSKAPKHMRAMNRLNLLFAAMANANFKTIDEKGQSLIFRSVRLNQFLDSKGTNQMIPKNPSNPDFGSRYPGPDFRGLRNMTEEERQSVLIEAERAADEMMLTKDKTLDELSAVLRDYTDGTVPMPGRLTMLSYMRDIWLIYFLKRKGKGGKTLPRPSLKEALKTQFRENESYIKSKFQKMTVTPSPKTNVARLIATTPEPAPKPAPDAGGQGLEPAGKEEARVERKKARKLRKIAGAEREAKMAETRRANLEKERADRKIKALAADNYFYDEEPKYGDDIPSEQIDQFVQAVRTKFKAYPGEVIYFGQLGPNADTATKVSFKLLSQMALKVKGGKAITYQKFAPLTEGIDSKRWRSFESSTRLNFTKTQGTRNKKTQYAVQFSAFNNFIHATLLSLYAQHGYAKYARRSLSAQRAFEAKEMIERTRADPRVIKFLIPASDETAPTFIPIDKLYESVWRRIRDDAVWE